MIRGIIVSAGAAAAIIVEIMIRGVVGPSTTTAAATVVASALDRIVGASPSPLALLGTGGGVVGPSTTTAAATVVASALDRIVGASPSPLALLGTGGGVVGPSATMAATAVVDGAGGVQVFGLLAALVVEGVVVRSVVGASAASTGLDLGAVVSAAVVGPFDLRRHGGHHPAQELAAFECVEPDVGGAAHSRLLLATEAFDKLAKPGRLVVHRIFSPGSTVVTGDSDPSKKADVW